MTEQTETSDIDALLTECEAVIGHTFRDRTLLLRCLTHTSIARTRLDSNERMEFLGDSILGAIVCEQLYELYPSKTEGEMTRVKSVVVSRSTCAKISADLQLDRFVQLGKGLSDTKSVPSSIMAAVFESLVAGVFLDSDFDTVRTFVRRLILSEIERTTDTSHGVNYKSLLQQLVQRNNRGTPTYLVIGESGPDHSKSFRIAAMVGAETFASATGPNKKEAEQRAAENAYFQLQGEAAPHHSES